MVFVFTAVSVAAYAETEEQRLARIARNLRPISDSQWNEIARDKTDIYEIQKGDTLWDISKRLFGNPTYWPKIWALNAAITNPHIVSPGRKLGFTPGSSEGMPSLAPEGGTTTGGAAPIAMSDSSGGAGGNHVHEYDKVSQALWSQPEAKDFRKEYGQYGLDSEIRLSAAIKTNVHIPAIANDTTIPYLGEVVGSRRDGVGLAQFETLFLKSNGPDLQVGNIYSILSEPEYVRERKSDRSGYIYNESAVVRIIGVKDEAFVGVIQKSYDTVKRGDRLYPMLPVLEDIKPVAAKEAMESLVMINDHVSSNGTSAQFQFVHFDRGMEDGVEVGNVFRVYEYYDPATGDKLTDSDFMIKADVLVVHVTSQFSTGLVLRSREMVSKGDFGVLLTDVSDLTRKDRGAQDAGGSAEDKELDELDALDRQTGEGLGRKEQQEIKQLQDWDDKKDPTQKAEEGGTAIDVKPDEATTGDQTLDGGMVPQDPNAAPGQSPTDPHIPENQQMDPNALPNLSEAPPIPNMENAPPIPDSGSASPAPMSPEFAPDPSTLPTPKESPPTGETPPAE